MSGILMTLLSIEQVVIIDGSLSADPFLNINTPLDKE